MIRVAHMKPSCRWIYLYSRACRYLAAPFAVTLAVAGCDRSPSIVQEKHEQHIFGRREAYCLVAQARFLATKTIQSNSLDEVKACRDESSRILGLVKVDEEMSRLKLPELYGEVVRLNDARDDYLSNIYSLSRSLIQREKTDHDAAVRKGLVLGAQAGALGKDEQEDSAISNGLKSTTKFAVTGYETYTEEEKRLKALREQDKQGLLSACEKKLTNARNDFTSSVDGIANVLEDKLNLSSTELGLASIIEEADLQEQQDRGSMLETQIKRLRNRPNDSILHACVLANSVDNNALSEDICLRLSRECSALVGTIPNKSYLQYTKYIIFSKAAIIVENWLYAKYPFGNSWGSVKTHTALVAAAYRGKAIENYSADDGMDAVALAWDYFLGGDLANAVSHGHDAQTKAHFQRYSGFCFKMAQLGSLVGQANDSLAWLNILVDQFHYSKIKNLREDSDLEFLRKMMPDEFSELVKVKYDWSIVFGVFNDDITLTNKSRFPITFVRFKPHIESSGRQWNLYLETPRINPGETQKWEDVLSIPGSHRDRATGELQCNQTESE